MSRPTRRTRREPKALRGVCRSRKVAIRSYRTAAGMARRLEGTVYFCARCGFYHVTANEPGDFDRMQAEYLEPHTVTPAEAARYIAQATTTEAP